MSTLIATPALPVPLPQLPIAVRVATLADVPFIDGLQKQHAAMVGWMPTAQLEGKILAGQVLVAEEPPRRVGEPPPQPSPGVPGEGVRVGYVIGQDRYFKRDDVGIVYQINVVPRAQRSLIAATLLRALFDRAAYGCKLFCCWCAQDIAANRFWEAMGFVPLAFRAGSEKKARVHIFWQKRIRAGDDATPWWFPAKTDAGALREDRLVLPIPSGKHWSDEMPRILPTESPQPALEDQRGGRRGRRAGALASMAGPVKHGPRQFGPPPTTTAISQTPCEQAKPKPQRKPKRKADPKLVAAARELRDRWLEKVNAPATGEPQVLAATKYDVSRQIQGTVSDRHLLPAA